jgi:pimeloyl-ACP methyl ester carboxylesterase
MKPIHSGLLVGARASEFTISGKQNVMLLDLPGVRLRYDVSGKGPPLVLVHGSAVDRNTWAGVAPELSRAHSVITYDRRGYGESLHRPVRDHRLHADDLIAVLEKVAKKPSCVVGWSSGGNVALAVAVRRPELFSSLIVVEAPFHGQRHMDAAVLRTLLRLKFQQLRGRPVEALEEFLRFGSSLRSGGNIYDRLPAPARQELLRYPSQVLAEWDPHPFGVMHEHASTRSVAAITVPMIWVLGGESSPWLVRLHDYVKRRKPDMTTVVIPGASHLVHIDNPTQFVETVNNSARNAS